MFTIQSFLIDTGRIGIGVIFLSSVILDFKCRSQIFALMSKKKVPLPWVFFIGASLWKIVASTALILSFYTLWAALLLSLYIFIANIIFNNFWAVPNEQKGFCLSLFMMYLAACFGLLVVAACA